MKSYLNNFLTTSTLTSSNEIILLKSWIKDIIRKLLVRVKQRIFSQDKSIKSSHSFQIDIENESIEKKTKNHNRKCTNIYQSIIKVRKIRETRDNLILIPYKHAMNRFI